ncbi:hypothetical protein IQ238_23625 [Pleurocapsales cyanobacterium LEGE 06147]|nr:hypothetical protein [Pleurocapsales cyanobacterium LEGE 06147]
MTNQPYSRQTIGDLTLLELEQLIENIAKKTVQREMMISQKNDRQLLAETFGAWEDDKTEQEMIEEIYESRNTSYSSL